LVRDEEVPATPSAAEVEEILKVMTESLPVKLSPLAPELTKFFQKDKEASAAESPSKPKKHRIIQVTDVIHQTPPPVSTSKIVVAETAAAEATGAEITEIAPTGAEATGAEAEATEDSNLETTLEVIDNILLKMAEKEVVVAAVNTATEKGKEQIDEISEEGDFNFQDLLGQELTDAEKEELKKYAISCGYKSGATLFGGVNERKLRCLRNRTEAKIVRTLSKSVGLPKIEANLCRYQRHHVAGSLLYANFKVKILLLFYYYYFLCLFLTKVVLAEYIIK
jgi:Asp-tRNA(Asn)/Glu-tRNA(Gln) amidotransferase A subunit family amidase